MVDAGVDTLVMGCTHYPFVIPLIQKISGPAVKVIDPAPAVARQARRLLGLEKPANTFDPLLEKPDDAAAQTRFFSTGDTQRLAMLLPRLLKVQAPVSALKWHAGVLVSPG